MYMNSPKISTLDVLLGQNLKLISFMSLRRTIKLIKFIRLKQNINYWLMLICSLNHMLNYTIL